MMMLFIWVKLPKLASDKGSESCFISQVASTRANGKMILGKEKVTKCIKMVTYTSVSFIVQKHKEKANTYGATGRHMRVSGIRVGSTAMECGKGRKGILT